MRFSKAELPNSIGSVEGVVSWGLMALGSRIGQDVLYDPVIVNNSTQAIAPIATNLGKLQAGENQGRSVFRFNGWFWVDNGSIPGVDPLYENIISFKQADPIPAALVEAEAADPTSAAGGGVTYSIPAELELDLAFFYQAELCEQENEDISISDIPNRGAGQSMGASENKLFLLSLGNNLGIANLGDPANLSLSSPTLATRDFTVLIVASVDPTGELTLAEDSVQGHKIRLEFKTAFIDLYQGGAETSFVGPSTDVDGYHLFLFRIEGTAGTAQFWRNGGTAEAISLNAIDIVAFDRLWTANDQAQTAVSDFGLWTAAKSLNSLNSLCTGIAAARGLSWTSIV